MGKIYLASGNPGKLKEYRALAEEWANAQAASTGVDAAAALSGGMAADSAAEQVAEGEVLATAELELVPGFDSLPTFDETAPTFAENAAGKALHYSQYVGETVLADDSGLVVEALGGAPGPKSARYGGPGATDADKVRKVLGEMAGKRERSAKFVCVIASARAGRMLMVVSDAVEGQLLEAPRGEGGFGYDPIFYYEPAGKTLAELGRKEKNRVSHRGKAFRKLLRIWKGG